MANPDGINRDAHRMIVVGGHTRNIGKTQLVCDMIAALPDLKFLAGKITQYGHGVCAQNGEHCGCAPDEHSAALAWETLATTGTDSSRFLAAGAARSFWLRTKQGYLAEGLPLLRDALTHASAENLAPANFIIESNSLLQFLKPAIYLAVLDPTKDDFKQSAHTILDRADAFVLRTPLNRSTSVWPQVSARLLAAKPNFFQPEGDPPPADLLQFVRKKLTQAAVTRI